MSRTKTSHAVLALPDLSALTALPALLPALLAASALLAAPALGQGPGREGGPPARPGAAEGFADRLMASDANKDGKLTLDEMDPQYGKTIMDRADANGDGFLTRDELIAMAKARIEGRPLRGQPPRLGADDDGDRDRDHDANDDSRSGARMGGSYHEAMEHAGRGLRGLRRSPMNASSLAKDLEAVQMMQMGLLMAKSRVDSVEMSENAEKIYGDDANAQHADMRLALIKVIIKTLQLEYALADGEGAKAKEIYAQIREMRSKAHDTFEPEDDDHEHGDDDRNQRGKRGGRGDRDDHGRGGGG
jgi:hypothetical protein